MGFCFVGEDCRALVLRFLLDLIFVAVRRRAFLLLVQLARARNETYVWTKQCVKKTFLCQGVCLSVKAWASRVEVFTAVCSGM